LIGTLVAEGKLQVPSDLGDEGFLIKSIGDGDRSYVVILGVSPRRTLYGLYHYLEQYCRVGFFWDGEHIPRWPSLPTAGIDTVERPRWPIRDILTIWAGKILDYAHRDYHELVRFYYRKRVEAFLAHAEGNLAASRAIVDDKQLEPAYQQIEQSFVKQPVPRGY